MVVIEKKVRVQFVSAEPEKILNILAEKEIVLLEVKHMDALRMEIVVYKRHYQILCRELVKNHSQIKDVRELDVFPFLKRMIRRPLMLIGIAVYLSAACILPGRILFVNVVGNSRIPDSLILSAAADSKIRFGCRSKYVRSEEAKNQILAAVPQLQWVGINTSGCVATIHVKERSDPNKAPAYPTGIGNVVSRKDGTITDMTVYSGTPLVSIGQSVKEGEILVSGYSDYGIKTVAQSAQAEIMAHTMRSVTFITPCPLIRQGDYTQKHICYRLRIGKKVINLCNHSGIPDTVCVRMYSEDYWYLPGGFQLPVSLLRIENLYYRQNACEMPLAATEHWLPAYAKTYLQTQMIAGQILDENLIWADSDTYQQVYGEYACHEMIGQVKYEEILGNNAEDN